MKHIIGIDFGTSTTMIKVREIDETGETGGAPECKAVTFTQRGIPSTPTLIRKQGQSAWYGDDAVNYGGDADGEESVLYDNFKLLLREESDVTLAQARALIGEFFKEHLFKTYAGEKNFLFQHNGEDVTEETWVSYPTGWGKRQRELMISVAREAGFPDVMGEDEASAAVSCVLRGKQKELEDMGALAEGRALPVLVVDMGAGTTDLAFVTVTVAKGKLCVEKGGVWPTNEAANAFGGRKIDRGLERLLEAWLEKSGVGAENAKRMIDVQRLQIKTWKEYTVSGNLKEQKSTGVFTALSQTLRFMGLSPAALNIDRDMFEKELSEELSAFAGIVGSAPKALREDVEIVILTGGNSEWYWIDDVLLGNDTRFGEVGLPKIKGRPERLLRMEQPAETVSRGLVYGMEGLHLRASDAAEDAAKPSEEKKEAYSRLQSALQQRAEQLDGGKTLYLPEQISVGELADKMQIGFEQIFSILSFRGKIVSRGYMLSFAEAKDIAERYGFFCEMERSGGGKKTEAWNATGTSKIQSGASKQKEADVSAQDFGEYAPTPETEFEFSSIGSDYGVKKYLGKRSIVVIPEVVRGRRVVAIGEGAFGSTKYNVTGIGANQKLETVVIPKSVKTIEGTAFCGCFHLKNVIAHDGIEKIGFDAFFRCTKLERVDFGMGDCPPKVVKFPKNLKEIGAQAFDGWLPQACVLKEVTLSRKTKLKSVLGMSKAFTPAKCAMFYYES